VKLGPHQLPILEQGRPEKAVIVADAGLQLQPVLAPALNGKGPAAEVTVKRNKIAAGVGVLLFNATKAGSAGDRRADPVVLQQLSSIGRDLVI
jgi:hypothetical protein